ncbi:MAG: F0F1 ATP synthase subunit epsilon [Pseudomonadota bacterium]
MADMLQFDLVSPEKRLASVQATEVQIPGADGDMTAMADHAPTLTSLRPGLLVVKADSGDQEYVVTGGFAEITAAGVTVLAERAMAKSDVSKDHIDGIIASAEAAAAHKSDADLDAANKTIADTRALADQLGL